MWPADWHFHLWWCGRGAQYNDYAAAFEAAYDSMVDQKDKQIEEQKEELMEARVEVGEARHTSHVDATHTDRP